MTRRERRRIRAVSHDRWLISYADFVTLLFALFIVLFASAYRDQRTIAEVSRAVTSGFQQLQSIAPPPTSGKMPGGPSTRHLAPGLGPDGRSGGVNVPELQQQLSDALGPEIRQKEVVLNMTPEGFVISLHELGFFASGQAELLPGAQDKLRRLADVLMHYGLNLRVEGHTDNVPIHSSRFDSNWELSTARASAVARMLLSDGNFDAQRLAIAGYGEYHPVASNTTSEGRQANRRVDIVLVTTAVNGTAAASGGATDPLSPAMVPKTKH